MAVLYGESATDEINLYLLVNYFYIYLKMYNIKSSIVKISTYSILLVKNVSYEYVKVFFTQIQLRLNINILTIAITI